MLSKFWTWKIPVLFSHFIYTAIFCVCAFGSTCLLLQDVVSTCFTFFLMYIHPCAVTGNLVSLLVADLPRISCKLLIHFCFLLSLFIFSVSCHSYCFTASTLMCHYRTNFAIRNLFIRSPLPVLFLFLTHSLEPPVFSFWNIPLWQYTLLILPFI